MEDLLRRRSSLLKRYDGQAPNIDSAYALNSQNRPKVLPHPNRRHSKSVSIPLPGPPLN